LRSGVALEHHRRHRRHSRRGELQQVALAEVPADRARGIPDRHAGGVEPVEPGDEGVEAVVVVQFERKMTASKSANRWSSPFQASR
jgi:hypothetical protein